MATIKLTKDNFEEEVVKSDKPVVIDFWASWCMPCQMMAPVFEELSEEYTGEIKFAKVNTEEEIEIAQAFGIRSIPTLAVMKDNKLINQILGFLPKETLKEKIDSIIATAKQ